MDEKLALIGITVLVASPVILGYDATTSSNPQRWRAVHNKNVLFSSSLVAPLAASARHSSVSCVGYSNENLKKHEHDDEREARAYNGGSGHSPQRGSGAQPLVRVRGEAPWSWMLFSLHVTKGVAEKWEYSFLCMHCLLDLKMLIWNLMSSWKF